MCQKIFQEKSYSKISFKFGSRFSKRISLSVLAQIVQEFLKVYLEVLQAYLKTTFPVLSLSSSWSLVGRREEETSYCIWGRVPSILNLFLATRNKFCWHKLQSKIQKCTEGRGDSAKQGFVARKGVAIVKSYLGQLKQNYF